MITSILLVIVEVKESILHCKHYYDKIPANGWQSNHSFTSGAVSDAGSVGGLSVANGSQPPQGKRGKTGAKAEGRATGRRSGSQRSIPSVVVSTIGIS